MPYRYYARKTSRYSLPTSLLHHIPPTHQLLMAAYVLQLNRLAESRPLTPPFLYTSCLIYSAATPDLPHLTNVLLRLARFLRPASCNTVRPFLHFARNYSKHHCSTTPPILLIQAYSDQHNP